MPNANISNNLNIANFLNNLKLPLKSPQLDQINNLTSGLINYEGGKIYLV